jgi:sigma-B regulation protein RsbU (phosphoserine phosphatase)
MDESQKATPRDGPGVDREAACSPLGTTGRSDRTAGVKLDASSPAFLQDILDSLADGVVVADCEGRFVQFNDAAKRFLGLGPLSVDLPLWSATYGCFREDRLTPFPSDELPLARSLRGETVYDCQLFLRNPSVPEGVWLSLDSSPLKDENGDVCGGVVIFRDVTSKKRELERVELLSAVVEQTADSVIITDREGVIEYVNPAAAKTTGFSERELVGRTPSLLRSGLHDEAFYADLWKTLLEGRVYRNTIINRKKDGDLYYAEQTITPIRDGSGTISHFVTVGKDVTEIRKASEQQSKLLLARSVQQRLYPAAPPEASGFDIAGNAFMADETGGDYFDFIWLPDGCMCVAVGDVSGHAFDAALLMSETRAYLRSVAQTQSDPGTILSLVNRVLIADIADNQFVTLLLVCLHGPSQALRYASAGHTTGYVLDASGAVRTELTSTGFPLGLFLDTSFETLSTPALQPGDLIALFSDGVTETESADGTPFGEARALEVVRTYRREPSAKIVNRIYRAVRDHTEQRPQTDDITAVVCKVGDLAKA